MLNLIHHGHLLCLILSTISCLGPHGLSVIEGLKRADVIRLEQSEDLSLCDQYEKVLVLDRDSKVEWIAKKNENVPVKGTISVSGKILLDKSLEDADISMSFNASTIESGIEIRNERIVKALLGGLENAELNYFQEDVILVDEISTLPHEGSTIETIFRGEVELSGISVPVEVPTFITADKDSYTIANATSSTSLDFSGSTSILSKLDNLMAMCGTESIASKVDLRFTLKARNVCIGN